MLAVAISFVGIILTGIIVAIALQAAVHAFRNSPDFKHMIDAVELIDNAYK
jgi:chromate transport protein ChrA